MVVSLNRYNTVLMRLYNDESTINRWGSFGVSPLITVVLIYTSMSILFERACTRNSTIYKLISVYQSDLISTSVIFIRINNNYLDQSAYCVNFMSWSV